MASRPSLSKDDVSIAARLKGLPPELALAIWDQESGQGRNAVTSPKGAVGGFQVTPDTFKRYYPGGNINDPVDNMEAGLRVLADGFKQAKGDYEKTAQFYYHGKILPDGVEGPDSGPGTPTTRGYGRSVAAKARGGAVPTTMAALATPQAAATSPDMFGFDDEEFNEPVDDDQEETDEGDIPDMAGLTGPLNPQNYMAGLDSSMNDAGGMEYELDKYIRSLVDEELKA